MSLDDAFHQTGISGFGLEHDEFLCLRCLKKLRSLYIDKMTSNYQELQKAVICQLTEADRVANRPNEVILASKSGEWTRQQLIEAIRENHYEGIKGAAPRLIYNLVKLSLDLVLRGTEKLEDFEVVNR